MSVKLVMADDNQVYLAVVDGNGKIVYTLPPQDTSARVSGGVTALVVKSG